MGIFDNNNTQQMGQEDNLNDIFETYGNQSVQEKDDLSDVFQQYGGSQPAPAAAPVEREENDISDIFQQYGGGDQERYTYRDVVASPERMEIVRAGMSARYGQQILDHSDEDLAEYWVEEARGRASGNSVRVLTGYAHSKSATDDELEAMRRSQELFDNMDSLFSKNNSWMETLGGVKDYVGSTILDPVNLLSAGVGSFVGKTIAAKGSAKVAVKQATKVLTSAQITKQVLNQVATKIITEKAAPKVHAQMIKANAKDLSQQSATVVDGLRNSTAMQKVMTKAGLGEIGAVTLTDALTQGSSAYVDQLYLNEIGSQEGIDKWAVGIATAGALVMGGLTAGGLAISGKSGLKTLSDVKMPEPEEAMKTAINGILDHTKLQRTGTSWTASVEKGRTLGQIKSEDVMNLLFGVVKDGEVQDTGIFQELAKGGYRWVKQGEDDKISDWVTDFVRIADQDTVTRLATMLGVKDPQNVKAYDLADQMVYSISSASSMMNNLSQIAKRLGVGAEDLVAFPEQAKLFGKAIAKPTESGFGKFWADVQNKGIRLLVSHPGTSILNAKGYLLNSALNTVKDVTSASLGAPFGKGGFKQAGHAWMAAGNRLRLAFDPRMTAAAFDDLASRNLNETRSLTQVISGGLDAAKLESAGKVSAQVDSVIDKIQDATFVHMQDKWSKSQEMFYQLDKNSRKLYDKSWNDLVESEDFVKIIASEDFSNMVAVSSREVESMIFSRSYKSSTNIGKAAGMIEDMRSIPLVGMLVPFGRFFNNTVDFGLQWTGAGLLAKAAGRYQNMGVKELAMKGAIGMGLVYSLMDGEAENMERGIGFGQYEGSRGQVEEGIYDYPLSMFRGLARILHQGLRTDEGVAQDEMERFVTEFLGGNMTRNPDLMAKDVSNKVTELMKTEDKEAMDYIQAFGDIVGSIFSQFVGGSTRFLEPVDTAIGIAAGTELAPSLPESSETLPWLNPKATTNALRYVDNIREIVFDYEPKVATSVAGGKRTPMLTKAIGAREVVPTSAERVMAMSGMSEFKHNLERKLRESFPEISADIQELAFKSLEQEAQKLLNNKKFLKWPREVRQEKVKEMVKNAVDLAEYKIFQGASDVNHTFIVYELLKSGTESEVKAATQALGFDKPLYELTREEAHAVKQHLDLKKYKLETGVSRVR